METKNTTMGLFTHTLPALYSFYFSLVAIPTELPDSLGDAAEIAANACADFSSASPAGRCRVDFDTAAGDETYPILKTSTEFMQQFVSALCYRMVPGLQDSRQQEMMSVVQARTELQALENDSEEETDDAAEAQDDSKIAEKKAQLMSVLERGGRAEDYKWEGPVVRVYFPDEGNAALARRDWQSANPELSQVPPCVQFSSCGGQQMSDISNDMIVLFFCPKASESDYVEELLLSTETKATDLQLTVFVNPNLVDMGVTGFGFAARLLRERLIDGLVQTYYLRTLQWGAITRVWPQAFSVWQEDEKSTGGYQLVQALDRLPSNPEVEDIYDIHNGLQDAKKSGGPLDALGDFVNGMMRL